MAINVSAWSIRNPVPATLLFALLTLAGLFAFRGATVQHFPDVDLPMVVVTASLPGTAPAQMETEVARRLHAPGKCLAVHVDGESRGVLGWLAECGVDCADAVRPQPTFALTPAQMRAEAGPDLILSGGIPATVFRGGGGGDAAFLACVRRWLETRLASPRLMLAAGDQVPPDASWRRIAMRPERVAKYGGYG